MTKIFLLIICFNCFELSAKEFDGCGRYYFQGIVQTDDKAPLKLSYVIRVGSESEMTFEIVLKDDLMKAVLLQDVPTSLKADILKPMKGSRGKLINITELSRRVPNPVSSKDSLITKLQDIKCQ